MNIPRHQLQNKLCAHVKLLSCAYACACEVHLTISIHLLVQEIQNVGKRIKIHNSVCSVPVMVKAVTITPNIP